jgi:hypothetical protein
MASSGPSMTMASNQITNAAKEKSGRRYLSSLYPLWFNILTLRATARLYSFLISAMAQAFVLNRRPEHRTCLRSFGLYADKSGFTEFFELAGKQRRF